MDQAAGELAFPKAILHVDGGLSFTCMCSMPLLHIPASGKATPAYDLGEYAKKAYLFDTTAEFHFFCIRSAIAKNP